MAVPGEAKVGFDPGRGWDFPDGTALVQTLSLEREPGNPASRFRVETRVLLRQQGEWAGYSYRWNAEQTDATLVAKDGEDADFAAGLRGPGPRQKWRFPSRAECMACHSRAASFVLGVTGIAVEPGSRLRRGARQPAPHARPHRPLHEPLPKRPERPRQAHRPRRCDPGPRTACPDVPARQLLGLPRRGRRRQRQDGAGPVHPAGEDEPPGRGRSTTPSCCSGRW